MKKLIALILILVVTPFFVVSEKPLIEQVELITKENSKNPEFEKWEYVKDRVFDENGVIQKGYDKPVKIDIDEYATYKDSLVVSNFIDELRVLMPSIKIGFKLTKEIKPPFHYVSLGFRNDSITWDRFLIKKNLLSGSVLGITRPGFVTSSDGSKYSFLNFNFTKNINDEYRKLHIEQELLREIFSTKNMEDSFNNLFQVQTFNDTLPQSYGFMGELDKFLLQKLYSDNFLEQFKEYLYANYPWRYANSFLNKSLAKTQALIIVLVIGILVFILMFGYFQNRKFKYSYLNYFIPVLFILFHIVNLYNVYKYLTDFDSFIGWNENIVFMLTVVPLIALLISLLLWLFDKFVVKENMNFTLQLVSKVVVTFITFNIPIAFSLLLKEDASIYDSKLLDFYFPMLFMWLALSLGRGFLIYLNHFSDSLLKAKDVELSRLRELKTNAELKSLQSQINPHFLYNALNSIASLAPVDTVKTQKMAHSLSDLFKYTINRKGKKMSTVSDEIIMVQNYLDIEKIRFGDRLQFKIDVDIELEKVEIPLFIIQPLVENAVKHGISKIEGEGKIALKIEKTATGILIVVKDNGPHFPEGLVSGHGLQTVFDLLRLTYRDKATLNWQNSPEKSVTVSITQNA